MNDRARRIANLSPEQRRLLELMLLERAQKTRADEGIPALPRRSESGQSGFFPLSPAQRWLWHLEQRRPGKATYNVALPAMRLRGALDIAALEASLREICMRHEVLRTTFGTRDGEPVQIVGPPRPVSLTRVDLRELSPPAREAESRRLLVQETQHPFDLSRDLMLHATLLRLDDEEHVLLPVMPHLVSDGWSVNVLFQELWASYKALRSGESANLPELPVQYVDYVVWQRQRLQDGALQQQTEYWEKQLADAPEVLGIPTDHPRPPAQTSRGTRQEWHISLSLVQELYALYRRHNVTLFVALLAAWATLLHRYSGQDDILIATPFANRNRVEVEGLVGFFANLLLLRHDLAGDPTFSELLERVRETAVDAFSHGELPFEKLVEELDIKFKAAFFLRETSNSSLTLDGLQVEQIKIDPGGSSPFLTLFMIKGDNGLTARLDYRADLFEATTIARMLEHFRALLESVVADPEQRLSKLPIRPARPAQADGWQARFGKRLRRTARRARRAAVRYLRGSLRRAGRWRRR